MQEKKIQVKSAFTFEQLKGIRQGIDILTGKLFANTETLGQLGEEEAFKLFLLTDFKNQLSNFLEDFENRPKDEDPLLFLGREE